MLDGVARVIRFDPRGCGRSSRTPPYTVATCVADLEAIRRHYGIERWVVAGHSWGADLALIYALHEPGRVLGFACIAGGRLHNDREWHAVYTQRREQGLERELDFAYPPNMDVNAQVNQSWKQYIQHPSLLKALSQLDRPALFLYGERDIRPVWPVEQIAQLLPQARFERIAGADHYIWKTHGDVLQARLRDFIRRVAA